MDLRVLTHRTYALALSLMAVSFMSMLGAMILLPMYLQEVRGLSPLQTGLLVMPGGLAMGLLGPTVGRVFDRFGGRVLVVPGAVGLVVALAGLAQVDATTPYAFVLGVHVLLSVALAGVFTPVFTLGLGSLPAHLYSHGSSMLGTLQQVAAAFGTALVVTVMTARATSLAEGGTDEVGSLLGGLQSAFLVGAVVSVAVIAIAVLLPNRADHPEGAQVTH